MKKITEKTGGFVEMGGEERADDVPARLSKNEFVFTADAVRNAGGGDIDRGSEVMQNMMDNLEQGGQVSEDSQGLGGGEEMMSEEEIIEEPNGAQAMYEQQQALQSRMSIMAISDFIEPAIKDYATQATAAYSAPINTDTFTGRQFVAGQDPMQTQAAALATQGVGSYQPYLQAAQTAQTQGAGALGQAATAVGGLGAIQNQAAASTGANAYQPFMSPYQSQVIDATLSEYDKSRLQGQQQIRDAAVNSGNFGGGREGAMMGQYNADSLVNRGALQSQMLQQGFGQAQSAANKILVTKDNYFKCKTNRIFLTKD